VTAVPATVARRDSSPSIHTLLVMGVLVIAAFALMAWLTSDPERSALVQRLVQSPVGLLVLFGLSALSTATMILPAPGLALTAIAGGAADPVVVGLVAGLGQAIGELTGYFAGQSGRSFLPESTAISRLDRWLQRGVVPLAADLERLPLAAGSIDLVWSNMALHWVGDPLAVFREFARVVTPDGLVMFSTLGPDTLKELRAAAGDARVHVFPDMHDLGDMLVAAGLTNPVMEMEIITVDYPRGSGLLDDLRASGQTNARADRPRGLAGRAFGERLRAALDRSPRITYEVVYGHAWKPARKDRASDPAIKTVRVFKRIP